MALGGTSLTIVGVDGASEGSTAGPMAAFCAVIAAVSLSVYAKIQISNALSRITKQLTRPVDIGRTAPPTWPSRITPAPRPARGPHSDVPRQTLSELSQLAHGNMSPSVQSLSRLPVGEVLPLLVHGLSDCFSQTIDTVLFRLGPLIVHVFGLSAEQSSRRTGRFENLDIVKVGVVILEQVSNIAFAIGWRLVWFVDARQRRFKLVVPRVKSDLVEGIDNWALKVGHEFEIGSI